MAQTDDSAQIVVDDRADVGVCVVTVRVSHVDISTTQQLKRLLKEACEEGLRRGREHFVLDMLGVSFIDSTGLVTLVAVNRVVQEGGGRLVVAASLHVVRVLMTNRLDQLFLIVPDVEQAVDWLRREE